MTKKENTIVDKLREWNIKATSGHNDGWTQKHYRDKIQEVRDFLESIDNNERKGLKEI